MKLWRFANAWDYHELGGFVTIASSAEKAAANVNAFIERRPVPADAHFWPGQYNKKPERGRYKAEDAEDVGPVFVLGGCDD